MVWLTVKPNLRAASCCRVEVVNGGAGVRFKGFFWMALHGEGGLLAKLQELLHLVLGLQALGQRGLHLAHRTVRVGDGEDAVHTIVGLALEGLQLALALNDESNGDTLHATCRQGGLYFSPKYG